MNLYTMTEYMVEFFTNHFEAILSFIGGCFAGGIGVHFFNKKNCNNSYTTQKDISNSTGIAGRDITMKVKYKQENINAGGDVAGRDINK